jgi:DNA repair protein SbcD/Mre11
MRLLLFSDLHLDSPFAWADPDLAGSRRQALRDTLTRICDLARNLGVDALCCAGDLFEHERCAPDTAAFVRDSFAALDDIRVFVAPGEQDWLGPASAYRYTSWTPNVRIFTEPALTSVSLADGLTVWGAAHRARSDTPGFLDGFHVDRTGVHVALFHGCERSELSRQGADTGSPAPFHQRQIVEAGLHHALVGHFRAPSDTETYTYAGNPEPLSFGEGPDGRGAALVTLDGAGWVSTERHRVAGTRMSELDVNVDGVRTTAELRDRMATALADASGIVRVTLVGSVAPEFTIDADLADRTAVARQLSHLIVRLDGVRVGYDLKALALRKSVRGRFVADVCQSTRLSEQQRQRVLITGLRALAGRDDLAVL